MKLNRKGTTVVELVITFAILMILVVGMLQLIMAVKGDASDKSFQKKMLEYRSTVSQMIESDLTYLKYDHLSNCSGVSSPYITCKNIHFKDGSVYELRINLTSKVIRYHDLNYDIPNGDLIEFLDNRVYGQNPLNDALNVSIQEKNGLLVINVPYFEVDKKDNYGFKIVFSNYLTRNDLGGTPFSGDVLSSVQTSYGYSYLEGIYPTNAVDDNYSGTCNLQINETTADTGRYIYYYGWNEKTKSYEKITKDSSGKTLKTNGIKYINTSKTDGFLLMQWYLEIDGVKYYTPLYKRNCSGDYEVLVNNSYVDSVNSKYSSSTTAISAEDSILITTANYQYTYKEFQNNSTYHTNVLNDIRENYIFTAPHSVKQLREGAVKASDVNTGVICETLAKLTNSVCISRKQLDNTDPNYDSYGDSLFQNLAVSLVDSKALRLLVDVHGIANTYDYQFAIGTRAGAALYNKDQCKLEQSLANTLTSYAPSIKISMNSYGTCNFNTIPNSIISSTTFQGGKLIENVKKNSSTTSFSAVQVEISNSYRTDVGLLPKTIDALYSFVQKY